MFRKLVLPAACAVLLGGCVSYGYSGGYGSGGYYYGQPSVRYYGGASYGYPYSSYPYSRYYGGSRYGYGYPYGYGGYYGHPYYPYYPRHPRGGHGRDDHDRDGHDNPPPSRPRLTGTEGGLLREAIRRQNQMPMRQPARGPSQVPTLRGRLDQPRPAGVQQEMRPRMQVERRMPMERREPAPARNLRERDVRRGQEP